MFRRGLWILVCISWACDSSDNAAPRPALTREQLLDPTTCKDCHPKHYNEWSGSMHAYATKDPVFLAMNKRGQEETGNSLGPFCVQCHAPMAVKEKAITDFSKVDELPEHLQGVTCYFCHNATSFGPDHNNAMIDLANDTTMRAAIPGALIPSVHKVQRSKNHDPNALESSLMCGTCHDIVTQNGYHLEQTLHEYTQTFMADATKPLTFQSCQNCHMEVGNFPTLAAQSSGIQGVLTSTRNVHEHFFPAVDLPLTDFPHADAMRLAVESCQLPKSIGYFDVQLRQFATFDVLFETQAAHAQPSGASQDRRMWLEVDGFDENDQMIYSGGVIQDGQVEEPPDQPAHPCMMRDYVLDENGKETHMFWEAAKLDKSKTIPLPSMPMAGSHTRTCAFGPRGRQTPLPRLEFRFRMRPIGLDVLQDLVASGHLSPDIVAKMPTLTVHRRAAHWDESQRKYLVDKVPDQDFGCSEYKCMLDPASQGCSGTTGAAGSASAAPATSGTAASGGSAAPAGTGSGTAAGSGSASAAAGNAGAGSVSTVSGTAGTTATGSGTAGTTATGNGSAASAAGGAP